MRILNKQNWVTIKLWCNFSFVSRSNLLLSTPIHPVSTPFVLTQGWSWTFLFMRGIQLKNFPLKPRDK